VTNFNGISLSTVEKAAAFYEPLRYSFRAADRWKAEVGYISFVAAPPHREFGMHPTANNLWQMRGFVRQLTDWS